MEFREIYANGRTVYVDEDRSARDFVADLNLLCLAMQVDPNAFQVQVLL